MPNEIVRFNDGPTKNVVFTTSNSTTGGFNLAVFSGALVMVDSVDDVAGGVATLTWKCKEREGASSVYSVAGSDDVILTTEVQSGRAYALPDELFAAGYVMATTAAGQVTCRVIVKG